MPESPTATIALLPIDHVTDALCADGFRILAVEVRTRVGVLDVVARRDDTIVFGSLQLAPPGAPHTLDARGRQRTRRAAVAWMAANPSLQSGVRRYRFDHFVAVTRPDCSIDAVTRTIDAY